MVRGSLTVVELSLTVVEDSLTTVMGLLTMVREISHGGSSNLLYTARSARRLAQGSRSEQAAQALEGVIRDWAKAWMVTG